MKKNENENEEYILNEEFNNNASSENKPKKNKKEDPGMSIEKFLSINYLELHPLQKSALKRLYSGKILPQSEWKEIIQDEITKRA